MIQEIKIFPVVGYENDYEIRSDGQVKRISKTTRPDIGWMTGQKTSHGYRSITLTKNGKCRRHYIHRLLCEAFKPNPEKLPQVNHIDGNRQNNALENLEWVSSAGNLLHRSRILGKEIGESHHAAKITRVIVYKIRRLLASGLKQKQVAESLGLSPRMVSSVHTGKTWSHAVPVT